MRVLVTGGDGFIGAYTIDALRRARHEPQRFDRSSSPGNDVCNPDALAEAARSCDAVIHLAGVLGTAELFDNPSLAVSTNVQGTLNVLQVCESYGLRFVGITMPDVWSNVYQATKQCARRLASAWHQFKGLSVTHVRAFNAYGPGQKVFGVQKIVPTFAYRAWHRLPLPIWGDGEQTVDLVHAEDVGRMLVLALDHGGRDEVFDAGTGKRMSVNEVADLVLEIARSDAGKEYLPMRAGEHATDVVASGDGWASLPWHPIFDEDRIVDTIYSYRPGA